MKRKIIISVIIIVLCAALLISSTAFAGSGYADLPAPAGAQNLAVTQYESAENAKGVSNANTYKAVDSDTDTAWRSSAKTDALILTFKQEQSFNTIVLREKGWNIKKFNLSYYVDEPGNEHWEKFYEQDSVNDYRYCAFETVTAKQLKLEITESDSIFKIREFEIYNIAKKERSDFRVSDYVVTPQLASGEIFDPQSSNYLSPEYCDVVNQIHVIASAKWNDRGELVIPDGLTGAELKDSVQRLRNYYGEKDVEIFATVFFNACDPNIVMTQYKDAVVTNTVDFLLEYGYLRGLTLSEKISRLRSRLGKCGEFPHEIGIFLGYPVEDVRGFISNEGKNFKACGTWKVYGDGERAAGLFESYRRCTEYFCSMVERGARIVQLAELCGGPAQ